MQEIQSAPNQSTSAPNGVPSNKEVQPLAANIPEPSIYFPSLPSTSRSVEVGQILRTRCKQLGISLFFKNQTPIRSLGFTSAVAGEGKTFLARLTAEVMAEENAFPVTLLECNWENPTLGLAYNLGAGPGLSDWLLGRCPLEAIRRKVTGTLTVIPAGTTTYNMSQLLHQLQQRNLQSVLADPNEILIVDFSATLTSVYGPFLAQLADLLILVVRMGVTPEAQITEAYYCLKNAHVYGMIFNQVVSRIPRWLQRIL